MTQDELRQLFNNNYSCWADTTDGSDIMAMDADRFVEVVSKLMNEHRNSGQLKYGRGQLNTRRRVNERRSP